MQYKPFREPSDLGSKEKRAIIDSIEWLCNNGMSLEQNERLNSRNGPYGHKEPRLRSLCHLGIMLNYVVRYHTHFVLKCDLEELKTLKNACYVLIQKDVSSRPVEFRQQAGLDKGNGVIGFAWYLEYLMSLEALDLNFQCNQALFEEIVQRFQLDFELGRVRLQKEDETENRRFDLTFNHQLWAISVVVYFLENKKAKKLVSNFLVNHPVQNYIDGIIYHKSSSAPSRSIRQTLKMIKYYPKSVSYHFFNILALKRLAPLFLIGDCKHLVISRLLSVKLKIYHIPIILFERHGMRYNPVGFELGNGAGKYTRYFLQMLQLKILHLAMKYDWTDLFMDKNRLISRSYEILLK